MPKKIHTALRFEEKLLKKIDDFAEKYMVTRSDAIRFLLITGMEAISYLRITEENTKKIISKIR